MGIIYATYSATYLLLFITFYFKCHILFGNFLDFIT